MQATRYYTFIDGKTASGLINADRLNGNLDNLVTVLNGNIEDDNVKAGAKILVSDRDYLAGNKITGDFEFDAFPTVPDASIPDAKLSANVPLKDAPGTFSGKPTFDGGVDMNLKEIDNIIIEKVAGLPGWTSNDKGRLVYDTVAGKGYIGGNSTWLEISYTGGYTGGAVTRFSDTAVIDDQDGHKLFFEVDSDTPTVYIALKGEPFPKRYYLELPYHTHVFTPTAHDHNVTDPGHYHTTTLGSHTHTGSFGLSTHTHGVSGGIGNTNLAHDHTVSVDAIGTHSHGAGSYGAVNHDHYGVTTGGGYTSGNTADVAGTSGASGGHGHSAGSGSSLGNHDHTLATTSGTPSASASVGSENLGDKNTNTKTTGLTVDNANAPGVNTEAGVNIGQALSSAQKLWGDTLTVKIDANDVTSNILTATGWSKIGDGSDSHAFHTTGTGKMNASTWITWSAGLHILEILEPTSGKGCRVMIYIESY